VEIRKCLLGELIEPAGFSVPLDPLVETRCLEFLEPRAELGELIDRQFSYGFFDVFKGRHGHQPITSRLARHHAVLAQNSEPSRV
jgi:hypothetical protein